MNHEALMNELDALVAAALVRTAARRTLELAEELEEIARMKTGLCRLPGC